MAARLKEKYVKEIAPALAKEFSYGNPMSIPKLAKPAELSRLGVPVLAAMVAGVHAQAAAGGNAAGVDTVRVQLAAGLGAPLAVAPEPRVGQRWQPKSRSAARSPAAEHDAVGSYLGHRRVEPQHLGRLHVLRLVQQNIDIGLCGAQMLAVDFDMVAVRIDLRAEFSDRKSHV